MIPFNNPKLAGKLSIISKLNHYSSNGPYTKKCQDWLKKEIIFFYKQMIF